MLFRSDSPDNVDAAKALGMDVIPFEGAEALAVALAARGLLED